MNNIKKLVKRSGEVTEFKQEKIKIAILKALKANAEYAEMDEEKLESVADFITLKVLKNLASKKIKGKYPTVEEVQNVVESTLIEVGEKETAKKYIIYRFQRNLIREGKKSLVDGEKIIREYMNRSDWKVKENSNMDFSLQGLNNAIISEISKNFWLNQVYSEEIRNAHENGDFHIHDLGLLSTYCCGWNLEDLLLKGFGGVDNKIESLPPKHFKTALGQLVNFFYTLQGESAGAQAVSSFDTYLAPFVRFDNLSYEEVKQAMQEFVFNMNIPTRVGFQTPFCNLTMDVKCPSTLENMPIIIGGKHDFDHTYGEFQAEMDMINEAFCEVMMEGDAKGRIFTFPIPTYNITDDFDWDSKVVNKIMDMTAKYGIPYFSNFVNSDMSPEDVRSMCCRLRLDNTELRKRGGGLFGANPMTGSIGVVTINMARLGYLYKGDMKKLKKKLKHLMELAKSSLETKRKIIEKNTELGLYPYSRYYLSDIYNAFGEYWKNHFNTIGLNGMNECILNFTNKEENITTEFGQEFSKEILDYMNEKVVEFQVESDQLYNLEATPAEGTGYRLARIDKKAFPDIITQGEESPYYTNSTQLPVGYTTDIFEAIELQDDLQTRYTGGTVLHGFLGEKIEDPEVCKVLIQRIFKNYKLPYFTISPTFSICKEHGYLAGEQFECPTCGNKTEVWTRVVGFHRPVQNWNDGKQEEYKDRKEFEIKKALA